MRSILLIAMLSLGASLPVMAGECSSILPSTCVQLLDAAPTRSKTLTEKFSELDYVPGIRFPVEERSVLIDPQRYGLKPSDGTFRYYPMNGTVYRVENDSWLILEVIRNRQTAHLR